MNIFVSNINYATKEYELHDLFAEFGDVSSAKIVTDRETGRSRGFGFVEMPVEEEAKEAIKRMNGGDYNGNRIKVVEAQDKPKGEGGQQGGGFKRNNNNRERSY